MQIIDEQIRKAENLLIGGSKFDDERRNFIKRLDSCDLLAVPGSGKTTALQAKLYCMIKMQNKSSKSGILVLSHTNAAVEEIKKNLQSKCPELFDYPNFIGTVQDFVDTFLAIPYYNRKYEHSISRIDVEIYKQEFLKVFQNSWCIKNKAWRYYINRGVEQAPKFNNRLTSDGNSIPWNYDVHNSFQVIPSPPSTWNGHIEENRGYIFKYLREIKQNLIKRGILNYDDCYYLAQNYIFDFPRIITILRKRFPFVFVDETQDLQPHQLEIIDQLFDCSDVCLERIGDDNQTIYNSSVKNADCKWIPRNVTKFKKSMRLTSENASIVNSFMLNRTDGQVVYGIRELSQTIQPCLLIYDYIHKDAIKDKYIELINQYHLAETTEGRKYGFHIIGWNRSWNDGKEHGTEDIRLCNIFPEFEISKTAPETLADYIYALSQLKSTGQIVKQIYTKICDCLLSCNTCENKEYNGKMIKVPYTASTIKKDITNRDSLFVHKFNMKLLQVVKSVCMHNLVIALSNITELIKIVFEEYGTTCSDELKSYLSADSINIYNSKGTQDIEIHFDTVHKAKGQTHCATLYVETMYEGSYESALVLNKVFKKATKKRQVQFFSNPFYKESVIIHKTSHAQSAIKMVYVGLSRPTHLLCYAMHKSSFEKYDAEKLKTDCGWEIIDLTDS